MLMQNDRQKLNVKIINEINEKCRRSLWGIKTMVCFQFACGFNLQKSLMKIVSQLIIFSLFLQTFYILVSLQYLFIFHKLGLTTYFTIITFSII